MHRRVQALLPPEQMAEAYSPEPRMAPAAVLRTVVVQPVLVPVPRKASAPDSVRQTVAVVLLALRKGPKAVRRMEPVRRREKQMELEEPAPVPGLQMAVLGAQEQPVRMAEVKHLVPATAASQKVVPRHWRPAPAERSVKTS